MGWSCAKAAGDTLQAITHACINQKDKNIPGYGNGSTNEFVVNGKRYFFEASRTEHSDGAITGTIWKFLDDGVRVRRSGTFRIEGDGTVSRGPKFLKDAAKEKHPQEPPCECAVCKKLRLYP